MITRDQARKLEQLGVDKILVRSPMTCQAPLGVCRLCYGMDLATGNLVEEGMAVGIIAAQSIGEPEGRGEGVRGAAAPADLYDAVQPWRHLIGVVELAPAPEAAPERFQAVFGRSDGVFLVRPDGYVGFASGEHAWPRQLDAYCRLWLTAPAQVHTHAS